MLAHVTGHLGADATLYPIKKGGVDTGAKGLRFRMADGTEMRGIDPWFTCFDPTGDAAKKQEFYKKGRMVQITAHQTVHVFTETELKENRDRLTRAGKDPAEAPLFERILNVIDIRLVGGDPDRPRTESGASSADLLNAIARIQVLEQVVASGNQTITQLKAVALGVAPKQAAMFGAFNGMTVPEWTAPKAAQPKAERAADPKPADPKPAGEPEKELAGVGAKAEGDGGLQVPNDDDEVPF